MYVFRVTCTGQATARRFGPLPPFQATLLTTIKLEKHT